MVEPAASFVAHVAGRARTIYVGPEDPANVSLFTECYLGKAGEVLPDLFGDLRLVAHPTKSDANVSPVGKGRSQR